MYQSNKFKFLNKNIYKDYIPKIFDGANLEFPLKDSSIILRSSISDEGVEKLNSGISLTIGNIKTKEDYDQAKAKIEAESNLVEFIIQEEVFVHTHLTIYIENEFAFAEVTGTDEFIILSGLTHTGDIEIIKKIKPLIELIQKNENEKVLIECGLGSDSDFYLFQLMEIKNHPIEHYIKNDLFNLLVQKKDIYLREGFFNMLKTEYLAYKIRSKLKSFSELEAVFFNWVCLLHYFRLFCIQEKLVADAYGWQKFLMASFDGKSRILKMAKTHIKISSQLRKTEGMPEMPSGFGQTNKVFIGRDSGTYTVGEDLLILKNLDIDSVINLNNSVKVVISEYSSLLSHPVLLLTEREKFFVGGLSTSYLESLNPGDKLRIDFVKRNLELLSRKN